MSSATKTNVFISYSFNASKNLKEEMAKKLEDASYAVNYSEKDDISDMSDQYIWEYLKPRIAGSSVMIVIYSRDFERGRGGKAYAIRDSKMYDDYETPFQQEGWIYKEIRCALREQKNNALNGVIVVMPDEIHDKLYLNSICNNGGGARVAFNYTNYPPILKANFMNKKPGKTKPLCGCCFSIVDDSYIPIVRLSEFYSKMKHYIELVKDKRNHAEEYNIVKETK